MIDDLQTPKHKTNHNYRSYSPPEDYFFAQLFINQVWRLPPESFQKM